MIGVFVPWNPKRKDSPGWVTNVDGCDIWHGSNTGGYGKVRVGGRIHNITRLRYEREIGPIPQDVELDHYVCDNGAGGCCNPFHCRPVEHRENVLRGKGVASVHAGKTHCLRGHPFAGENLIEGRAGRDCRICRRGRNARARIRYRAALKARRVVGAGAPSDVS